MILKIQSTKRITDQIPINDENYLLSPADGVVSQIIEINGPKELGLENKKFSRVSIFMNVFDCHVNRVPSSGKIDQIFYKPGKNLNASLDKSSDENERNFVKMTNKNGLFYGKKVVKIGGGVVQKKKKKKYKNQVKCV